MPYDYATERPKIFTEDGQRNFLKILDATKRILDVSGAARFQEIMHNVCGDSWEMIACVDRLVELGEIREITAPGSVIGQHRVFVKARSEPS